ncbi:EF hand domain-containing protein [Acidovorax sp. 69]|uniref:XopAW family type III secretion system calcium-binding effector n=1 Tax=Acidovorax sp. 69 TaxID=2035202 RepID=UPI000C244D5A|nr:XopAW family type III secretion system calcium-binding effector [Acidovorax sp. 69]PJI96659.1 EF hand domain-containing protein [Acidovorax sp. 69]
MTTISSVSSAWSSASVQRAQRPGQMSERLLSKLDTDSSGGVDSSELQGLLDDVSKKTGVSTTTSSADLITQYDSNGDSSLNADELGKTLQNVLPAPPSTMTFAQSRRSGTSVASDTATGSAGDDLFGKVDSNGDSTVSKTELQALLEAMSGGTASQTGVSSDELFSQLDADGNGSLSQAEFDAARPSGTAGEAASEVGGGMQAMGGMPPPPGGPGGAGAASDSGSATYDPLDTNEDGVVSLTERLAGGRSSVEQDAITALFNRIDTDGDATLSASESKAFIDPLTSQVQPMTSTTSSTSSSNSKESGPRNDLARLADFARHQYEMAANDWNTSSSAGGLSAMA